MTYFQALPIMQGMAVRILGIETSCDECAVAVVEDGRRILSNVVASQVDLHSRYGGVVPEVASRQHVLQIVPTIRLAMEEASLELPELDAVAVTYGPGLAGSLLVGLNAAKALALSAGLPLLGSNHLEGHIYSAWLHGADEQPSQDPAQEPGFPLLCLIASGGHTDLIMMEGHGHYQLLGRTRDDAAGEAFDKAARILGLGFPGGPEIQRVAQPAPAAARLPRAWMRGTHDFSFSGLKTALLHAAQARGIYPQGSAQNGESTDATVSELAGAFQESVVDVIVTKTLAAAGNNRVRGIILGGGVTANALLRETFERRASVPVLIPKPVLCTDNGAMIAVCGYRQLTRGDAAPLDLDVDPSLGLG